MLEIAAGPRIHQNYPGQFRHLAAALQACGDELVVIGSQPTPPSLPGLRFLGVGCTEEEAWRPGNPEARLQHQLAGEG